MEAQFNSCQEYLEQYKNDLNSNSLEIDFISNLKILEFRKGFIKFSFQVKKETPCKIIFSRVSNYFGIINYIDVFGNRNINKVNYSINSYLEGKTFKVGELLIVNCEIEKVTNSLIFQRVIFEKSLNTKNISNEINETIANTQIIFKKAQVSNNGPGGMREKKLMEKSEIFNKYIIKPSKL
ncbi:hypothetical protein DICPUDRAFT_98727 [Dictyostelium purpureum]|uniref:Uncharacterized protein n=1 Tax=Dictyostelium purpureum TaxID=5786 RepID=F0ZT13_DICPU|nr:uncharacterized protein DICPUDRAFT_98727 [Dictyostelium purpureum]EGC32906.1 hypothetical protein DICPUDRAFT_98727 [Dictyostelium purpureum]|eukprot:XP_003290554.1 hypothetical protein DICPUDRAFT_98727 [Dictyostelium purpureum]